MLIDFSLQTLVREECSGLLWWGVQTRPQCSGRQVGRDLGCGEHICLRIRRRLWFIPQVSVPCLPRPWAVPGVSSPDPWIHLFQRVKCAGWVEEGQPKKGEEIHKWVLKTDAVFIPLDTPFHSYLGSPIPELCGGDLGRLCVQVSLLPASLRLQPRYVFSLS